MSKKKKTIEELLEDVLVPKEELLYGIPENWISTRFDSVLKIKSGDSLTKAKMNEQGMIPVYGGNGITGTHDKSNVETETIVIGRVGYYCGSVHLTSEEAWVTDNAFVLSFPEKIIDKKFIYWNLKHCNLGQYSKSSAQPVISGKTIGPVGINVPPYLEQKRIVEKVERLLGKIEEAKALIEEAEETFELRRAAILNKAFRGELSAKWREDNVIVEDASSLLERIQIQKGNSSIKSNTLKIISINKEEEPFELPSGWKWVRLGEISYYVTSGSRDWSKYYSDEGAMFIRTQDINKNSLNLSDVAYVSLPEKVEGKRSLVEKSDILTTITGANVGKCALVETNIKEAYVSQSVALTKLIEKSISKYIHLSLLSPCGGGNELEERAYGIGRPVLSLEDIKNIKIPLAPIEEQEVIVQLVETLLNNEKESLGLVSMEKKLETLKHSILNKAFRGELGTNDPTEESAIELLKEVLQEKIK